MAYLVYLLAVMLFAKRDSNPHIRSLRLYFSLAFLLMLTGSILILFEGYDTIWLYHIHAFFTILFLGLYYRSLFKTSLKKNTAALLVVAASLYLLYKNLILREYAIFDSIAFSIISASMVIYALMYFHQLLSNVTEEDIFRDFNFWLTSSFLIYFLGNFIIFLTYHYFTVKILPTYTSEERDILTNLWGLHNCLLFTGALTLLLGSIWISYRKRSVLSS
jgi:hypothetical protein